MPSGKGPLRIATDDFLETNPLSKWIIDRWKVVNSRLDVWSKAFDAAWAEDKTAVILNFTPLVIAGFGYLLTGAEAGLANLRFIGKADKADELLAIWSSWWKDNLGDPQKTKQFEVLGGFFSEPVLAMIGGLQAQPGEDPENYLRRVYGVLTSIVLAPSVAAIVAEVAGAGQIETVMSALQSVTAHVGIGSVGGIVTAAFLESGILPELGRSLKDRLRPTRFTESNIRDLYALGKVGRGELVDQLRKSGWRDQDIDLWIALAFKQFGIGELFDLYHLDKIPQDRVVEGLRANGVRPEDIPLYFALNPSTETADARDVSYRTAKAAFADQIITEETYRGILKFLDRSQAEIEILVAQGQATYRDKHDRLTQSAIKQAWQNNVLTDAEAEHWLGDLRLSPEVIATTLEIWRAEAAPKFLKLNTGTITAAYVAGVIDRNAASALLKDIGHTPDNASLILNLAEARNPDAFGKPSVAKKPKLTYGTLTRLLSQGLITADRMQAELLEAGYAADDAQLLTESAVATLAKIPRPLTQADVLAAYLAGVLDRTGAGDHLSELGYIDADVVTILDTFEAAHPEVFAPESIQSVRSPTVNVITDAFKNGIITEQDFYARMQELGYDLSAAKMYASLATTGQRKGVRLLTPSEILELFKAAILPYQEVLSRMTGLGYSEADALLLMQLHEPKLQNTDAWQNYIAGLISDQDLIGQLYGYGYTTEQIVAALTAQGGLSAPTVAG